MASTVWRGYITFGLISIPVRLFRAARAERVSFRRVYRSEPEEPAPPEAPQPRRLEIARRPEAPAVSPVQQVSVVKGTDEVLPQASVVKGYEYEKNRFVTVEPEELKSIAPKTSSGMEIQEFVQLADIDPVYFETSYYVAPEEAGEKAYALLYRSMQQTGLVAIAQFAMHNREHAVVLRPGKTGLLAHTMFYASEVRADEEYRANITVLSEKELDLAQTLVHSLEAPFQPEKYHDTYREKLESMLARKVHGQPIAAPEAPQKPAAVVDIADALRRSLANLKKPAAESPERRPKKISRTAANK
ncbi:MAG: Ku protein [Bryobacteraceae bacterium]